MSMDFSSWPREQEQSFVVYEQRAQESSRKAFSIGSIAGAIWLLLCVGIYFGVQPEHKDMTKGMNMDNLTKKSKQSKSSEAPKPAETKPAETKPAEAPAAEAKPAEAKPAEAKPAEAKPAAEEKKEEKK